MAELSRFFAGFASGNEVPKASTMRKQPPERPQEVEPGRYANAKRIGKDETCADFEMEEEILVFIPTIPATTTAIATRAVE